MSKKNLLIVFARNPQLGKVKTRLAATIGHELTLKIYSDFLRQLNQELLNLDFTKAIFYSDFIDAEGLFDTSEYKLYKQEGDDLGSRMENAFKMGFDQGFEKIVIVGTDIPDLNQSIIEQAFSALGHTNFVLGPADDGGYYLLGCKKLLNSVFYNIKWSTKKVLAQTINEITKSGKSYSLLQKLKDVDELEDLPDSYKQKYNIKDPTDVAENKTNS